MARKHQSSSDGHDMSRFVESRSTMWTLSGRQIFIRGPGRAPIFPLSWRDMERSAALDLLLNRSPIGRRGGSVEELHDRGLIKPRLWRDQAMMVGLLSWKPSHDPCARFQLKMAKETSTIEARLPRDRGPIAACS